MVRVEHRTVLHGAARSAGTFERRYRLAKRAVATHMTVHCDGRIAELVVCPRKIFTGAGDRDVARKVAAKAGWGYHGESNEDYCPAHCGAPGVTY